MAEQKTLSARVDAGIERQVQAIIDEHINLGRVEGDGAGVVVEKVELVTALTEAYRAGVEGMFELLKYFQGDSDDARDRLVFWSELVAYRSSNPEVEPTAERIASFVPFNAIQCAPEGGFTQEHREGQESLASVLIENFEACDDDAHRRIAAEMGYFYGQCLKDLGFEGVRLLQLVDAFTDLQLVIIKDSMITGSLRPADQDDHTHEHYLTMLHAACMPVWAYLQNKDKRKF